MSNSPNIDHGNSHSNINDQLSNNYTNNNYNGNNGSYGMNDNSYINNNSVNENNDNNLVNNLSTSSSNPNNNNNISSSLSISSSTSSNTGTNNGNLDDVCRDYLRNVCRRGKLCRFKHPDDNDSQTLGRKETLVFCHDFQNRECRRENCRFLHCSKQEEETFRGTGKLPSNIQAQLSNDNASTPVCKDFLNGTCRRLPGRCKYRHPVNDPEYPSPAPHANRNFDVRNGQVGANYAAPPNAADYQQAPYGGSRPGMQPSYGQYNDSYSESPNKRKRPYDAMYNNNGNNGPYGGNPYEPISQRPYSAHSPNQSYYGGRGQPAETRSYLEEENSALRRRIDDLKKQVSELISRNDFLVEQINQIRVQSMPAAVAVATATSVASLTQQTAPPVAVVSSTLGLTTPLSQSLSLQPQGAVISGLPPSSIVSSIASISIPTVTAPVSLVNSSGGATLVSYTPALLSSTAWSMNVEQ